jgi:hypothetical protein
LETRSGAGTCAFLGTLPPTRGLHEALPNRRRSTFRRASSPDPSRSAMPAITSAAAGSAHHKPRSALPPRPTKPSWRLCSDSSTWTRASSGRGASGRLGRGEERSDPRTSRCAVPGAANRSKLHVARAPWRKLLGCTGATPLYPPVAPVLDALEASSGARASAYALGPVSPSFGSGSERTRLKGRPSAQAMSRCERWQQGQQELNPSRRRHSCSRSSHPAELGQPVGAVLGQRGCSAIRLRHAR